MVMVIHDVRYALRWLLRRPRFTGAGVLLLAIGIGFTSAAFSVVNWLLIRPVSGISDDGRLATVWFEEQTSDGSRRGVGLSYPNYADVQRGVTALSGMAGFHSIHLSTATPKGVANPVVGEFATANYAHILEIKLQLGRWFDTEEDQPPFGTPVVVVSNRIWRSVFNADPNVLGKVLQVRDRQFTVIGVAPPGFHGTDRFGEVDLWLPGRSETYVTHSPRPATIPEREWGGFWSFVARLAPNATLPQARDQLQAGIHSLAAVVPEVTGYFAQAHPQVVAGVGVDPSGRLRQEAVLIMGITALVLIIAGANLANLLFIRGLSVRGEIAVRQALGAGMMRLECEQMTVGVILGFGGAAMGLPLGLALVRVFNGVRLGRATLDNISFDLRVFAFVLGAALIVGALVALAPTMIIHRLDLVSNLTNASRADTGRRSPFKRALAVAQVAASVVLVVAALLLLSTLRNLERVNLGFNPNGVVILYANPAQQGYSPQRQGEYWADLARRMNAVPGVEQVATASLAPFLGVSQSTRVKSPDPLDGSTVGVGVNNVSPNYFSILRIPIVRGRGMTPDDSGHYVVVLNETLAHQLFGPADPIGSVVELYVGGGKWQRNDVVGVAGDSRWNSLTDRVEPFLYTPRTSASLNTVALVRSDLPEALITAASRRVAAALDRTVLLEKNAPLSDGMESYLSERRMLMRLLALLALTGCALAGFGLYAAIAFTTAQRTPEFGVRLALGARGRDILLIVLREGAQLAAVGIAIGLGGAALATRILESRLYGVTPLDPVTYAAAALILGLVALLASLMPARAATRIAPVSALKYE